MIASQLLIWFATHGWPAKQILQNVGLKLDIDRGIGGNYPLCATGIASGQRFDRLGNLSLRQPAHLGDCAREFL